MTEAELIADGGLAASSAEFFRSPGFLEAEGTTHSLRIGLNDGELIAPLVVREIEGGGRLDAISPYGYPGLAIGGGPSLPVSPAEIDFSGTGLVTVFLRHSLGGDPPLAGATPRNVCLLSDPALDRKSRMSDRQQIRKNIKRGYEMEFVPGPESPPEARAGFHRAYTETMERTSAAERYFFTEEYFDLILSSERTWLALARDADGVIAAASIAAASDGMLHYYLSGTADSNLRDSPMKNVIEAMIEFAAEMDLPLNLGGGITPGDPLEEFKRGFANREEQWFTSELICDPAAYEALSPPGAGEYFPAYRAPAA
ncbi:MAG TPA: GNAT family N-acetyltransferase [Solirubrobacterales bacterium]|nr:GNAT family N-acetyltransferase [Solirubrobacterales bacterium]